MGSDLEPNGQFPYKLVPIFPGLHLFLPLVSGQVVLRTSEELTMVRLCLSPMIWMIAIGMIASVTDRVCAEEFPYVAFAAEAETYVRSGPGQKYYPTQQLPQGFAVEVYRHDGDGWCAVRPPEGSFSWVSAHKLRNTSQTVAEVADEGVVTRIGSSLSDARSTVQVLLPRGERVEIFPGEPTDNPSWLRIAAPAGEFRWIAARHLSRQPPLETAPQSPPSSGWTNQLAHNSVAGTAAAQTPSVFQHLHKSNGQAAGATQSLRPNETPGALQFGSPNRVTPASYDPNAIDVVAGSPADAQLAQYQTQNGGLLPQSSSPRIRFRGLSKSDSSAVERIEELQVRLSQIVVQPPQEWQFEQLQAEANRLLETTDSPAVRSQVRDVLDRMTRFQQVSRGYGENGLVSSDADQPRQSEDEGLTGMSAKVRQLAKNDLKTSASGANVDEPLYDAVGLLKPVASKRAKAPQYALVDDKGDVVSFITPTPDLNLQPYLGRRIGVHGKRGFMPEYRRAHVTVARVSPIESRIRR